MASRASEYGYSRSGSCRVDGPGEQLQEFLSDRCVASVSKSINHCQRLWIFATSHLLTGFEVDLDEVVALVFS